MAYLRIKEFLDKKKLTFAELQRYPGLEDLSLEQYGDCPLEITEEIAADLRKVAETLNINPLELLRPLDEGNHPGVADRLPENMTVGEWARTRGVSVKEAAMLADRPLLSAGEIYCRWFPDDPGCRR